MERRISQPPAAVPPKRDRCKASPQDLAEARADYLKAEAERKAQGYRYVCEHCGCSSEAKEAHRDAA